MKWLMAFARLALRQDSQLHFFRPRSQCLPDFRYNLATNHLSRRGIQFPDTVLNFVQKAYLIDKWGLISADALSVRRKNRICELPSKYSGKKKYRPVFPPAANDCLHDRFLKLVMIEPIFVRFSKTDCAVGERDAVLDFIFPLGENNTSEKETAQ